MELIDRRSPRARARITGAVYLLFFLTAIISEVLLRQAGLSAISSVSGDAAAVANGIRAHESLVRWGVALGVFSTACYVALMALFYQLFRPVSRSLSLIGVFLSLVGSAIGAFGSLFELAPFVVLRGDSYLSAFDATQLQAMALMLFNLSSQAGNIALLFFGLFQIVIGYVMFRSTFLPRILGVLFAMAGLGWLTFMSPPVASHFSTYFEVLGFVAEASLMLWLLVMGVNTERWIEQATAAGGISTPVSMPLRRDTT